jgi:SAM-dependent methyltransferase
MMSNINWENEWNDALADAMMNKCHVGDKGFSSFYDDTAEDYRKGVRADADFYQYIVDSLAFDDILRKGDCVLDIGSGPGTYTLPMAEKATSVTALDPSSGMLELLMRESAAKGLSNIQSVKSTWEDYASEERFDLVFVALSPGIKVPADLMKMERFSTRSCCYINYGEAGGNKKFSDDLWELVTGEKKKNNDFNVTYPFNLLYSKGRKPNVRFFEKRKTLRVPCENIVKGQVKWLSMFTQMDREKEKKIRDYVTVRSKDGYYEHEDILSLVALYWEVPRLPC